jgi:ketosteroid isomerase-like protein
MRASGPDDPVTRSTLAAVERLNRAFDERDADAIVAAMTDDCVFENTFPPPDGQRCVGREANRALWAAFFVDSPKAAFEAEETFACGDRCVVRWVYRWVDDRGEQGHVRGVDVFRVRDGLVAEKLSYVKG